MFKRDERDETGYGLNSDPNPHDYRRCGRCGFVCRLSRDLHLPRGSRAGWGTSFVRFYKDIFISAATVTETTFGLPAVSAILTEDGMEIITEDGQILEIEQ